MTAVQNGRDRKTPEGGRPSRDKDPGPRHSRLAVPRTRMGELWVAVVLFAFVLLLLLIFVLQNGQRADVSFLGAHGQLPVGVALLLAAVFGVLLVALPGTARVVQLRMLARRSGRARGEPLTGPIQRAPDDHNPAEH